MPKHCPICGKTARDVEREQTFDDTVTQYSVTCAEHGEMFIIIPD